MENAKSIPSNATVIAPSATIPTANQTVSANRTTNSGRTVMSTNASTSVMSSVSGSQSKSLGARVENGHAACLMIIGGVLAMLLA